MYLSEFVRYLLSVLFLFREGDVLLRWYLVDMKYRCFLTFLLILSLIWYYPIR